jgi:phospholipid/cholesterol/gamma-HCH transport system substrate-binding protein
MRSRVIREGSVGLLLLLGLGIAVGIIAWLRGTNLGGQYSLEIELADAIGLSKGSPVNYRGVKVGRVQSLIPSVYGVTAQVDIAPASFVIPRDSEISVTQSGFIGQVELSIQPRATFDKTATYPELSPFQPKCEKSLILCDGDRLSGTTGANFDELIRSTTKLTALLSDSKVINNANTALKSINTTALSVTQLSRNANKTLRDVSLATHGFTALSQDARQQIQQFGTAAGSVTKAADNVTALVQDNRAPLMGTLSNLQDASKDLKVAVKGLSPILSRVENGKLLSNLETLAENGAKASANLKTLSTTLNNPVTLLGLAQTLDSARATFQNTQKITTDLEQVTGDPKLRQNIIKLINGLSKLLSSTQTLEQQVATLRQAENTPLAASLSTPQPSSQYFGRLTAPLTLSSNLFTSYNLFPADVFQPTAAE